MRKICTCDDAITIWTHKCYNLVLRCSNNRYLYHDLLSVWICWTRAASSHWNKNFLLNWRRSRIEKRQRSMPSFMMPAMQNISNSIVAEREKKWRHLRKGSERLEKWEFFCGRRLTKFDTRIAASRRAHQRPLLWRNRKLCSGILAIIVFALTKQYIRISRVITEWKSLHQQRNGIHSKRRGNS